MAAVHLGIAMDAGAFETSLLKSPGGIDALFDGSRTFGLDPVRQIFVGHRRHFDVDVDSIQQGPGYFGAIALDLVQGHSCLGSAR